MRDYTGPFNRDIDDRVEYWSSTLSDANQSFNRGIGYNGANVGPIPILTTTAFLKK
jgi:hypothetical protein